MESGLLKSKEVSESVSEMEERASWTVTNF